jgi:signal transduction histidine kinase
VYQEALTNIARHANATEVHASFEYRDGAIQLIVRDNGVGIDLEEVKNKNSLGLIGMKERARLLGGDVTISNLLPHGAMMTMEVPVAKPKQKDLT